MKKIPYTFLIVLIGAGLLTACSSENKIGDDPIFEAEGEYIEIENDVVVNSDTGQARESIEAPEQRVDVDIEGSPILGSLTAPNTIIIFSDFQCPYCKSFYDNTLPELKAQQLDTGNAKLVFKHLPLYQSHAHAVPAAVASECAKSQGRFWDMHNILFDRWNEWQVTDTPNEIFKTFAADLNLQENRFNECLEDEETLKHVGEAFYKAGELEIRVTPTFVVNGKVHTGFKSYETLSELLK